MVDTVRTEAELINDLFQAGQANGSITSQEIRDFVVSIRSISGANDHIALTNNPHTVTLEQARTAGNALTGDVDVNNNNLVDVKGISFKGGQEIAWNPDDLTLDIPTGDGSVLQVGQEEWYRVHNDTGDTLINGTVVHPGLTLSAIAGVPNVVPTQADKFSNALGVVMVLTTTLEQGAYGFATIRGLVRNVDTSYLTPGVGWMSTTDPGKLQNTKPTFPDYDMAVCFILNSDADDGLLLVSPVNDVNDTFDNFWNGTIRESFEFLITSTGGVVTGSLSPTSVSHPNLTLITSDGFTNFIATPDATIVLTHASVDTAPQSNYVYILNSTKLLTVNTSGWPVDEHIKIAYVILQTAAKVEVDGALRNHNINDHIQFANTNGHLSHITERIRKDPAKWDSGTQGISTIDDGSTPDDVFVSVTAGVVYQLHKHAFPALDTQTGAHLHIINNFNTPFLTVTNLNTQLLDALGSTLNNTSFSFVLWGVVSKEGEPNHLMINLPIGSYGFINPEAAIADAENKSVFDIPTEFEGNGFLIARFTYTYKNDEWTLEDTEDLRGKVPNSTAGGGGGGSGVTTYLALADTPTSFGVVGQIPAINDTTDALEFVDPDHIIQRAIVDEVAGISKGEVVYITGASGGSPTVALADSNNHAKADILAVAYKSGSYTQSIEIITNGIIRDINTFGFTAGDTAYLDGNGTITNVHPAGTDAVQIVGHILTVDNVVGSMLVDLSQLSVIGEFDGVMRQQIVNLSSGTGASCAYTLVNEVGHRASISMVGAGFSAVAGIADTLVIYNEGYNNTVNAVDGNFGFEWWTDVTDSHDLSATAKMTLGPTGDFAVTGSAESTSLKLTTAPAYADDAAAGTGGLTTGQTYQTTGLGAAPLNVAGILMIKQ
jgi:hypothetical protein